MHHLLTSRSALKLVCYQLGAMLVSENTKEMSIMYLSPPAGGSLRCMTKIFTVRDIFMCGIAGFSGKGDAQVVSRMIQTLTHRGPDDHGVFFHDETGLAHARLSIIDLSPAGHQPMSSADGKVHIIFNGEIYNYKTLKAELSYPFKSESDTEVLLALYQQQGVHMFEKLNGMFALAIYDEHTHSLVLARDRLGKKPLYYSVRENILVFGSEPKAILAHPAVSKELNLEALGLYLQHEYVPTPLSIFKHIYKVEPGTYGIWKNQTFNTHIFWKPVFHENSLSFPEAVRTFDGHLDRSVSSRLIADVPLGIFLSGGIDSSTIAYYAQKHSSRKIQTFSIGFDETNFDESQYAQEVADYLGTDHHTQRLEAKDALELIPHIAEVLDEPMADPSLLPTYLLSRFTRQHVTVALGGDGGDELLAGYDTFRALKASLLYEKIPPFIRDVLIEPVISLLPETEKNASLGFVAKRFTRSHKEPLDTRIQSWIGSFSATQTAALLISHTATSGRLPLDTDTVSSDPYQQLSYQYLRTYLLDDILVKVDRASMYHSLEVRAPFLDYELVDFVNSLPSSYKLRGMTTKYLLKETMKEKLPSSILHRKKKGFGIPLHRWLRNELRDLAKDLFSESRLEHQGIFEPKIVTQLLTDHISGKRDYRKELWTLMVFQMWYDRWGSST